MKKGYINKKNVIEEFSSYRDNTLTDSPEEEVEFRELMNYLIALLNRFPESEAEDISHGKWMRMGICHTGFRGETHLCSVCKGHGFEDYKSCPHCRALMDL